MKLLMKSWLDLECKKDRIGENQKSYSKGSIQFSFLGVHRVDLRCKIKRVELGNVNGMVSMKAFGDFYLKSPMEKKDIFSSFTYSVLSYWHTTMSKSPQNIMDLY